MTVCFAYVFGVLLIGFLFGVSFSLLIGFLFGVCFSFISFKRKTERHRPKDETHRERIHAVALLWRSEENLSRSFFPSTTWLLVMEFRSWSLVASAFTY